MKRKIIIDTDPGIDDALALIFALKHPEVEILGVTTAAGNKGLENTTANATRILNEFQADTMVYKGYRQSYSNFIDERFNLELDYEKETIHGEDGLGAVQLNTNDELVSETDAVLFILDTIKKYPNEIDIIALGPLTNIAYCIERDEETMKRVKSIHSMGGGVYRGNRTPVAEFNYWFDPHAVNKVFSLGSHLPIYMVGLDVTHQALLDMNDLTFMRLIDPYLGELIHDMLGDYIQSYWEQQKIIGAVMHDLTAIVGYVYPEIYTKIPHCNLQCVTDSELALGQSIVDLDNKFNLEKNAYVPLELNIEDYKNHIIKTLFGDKNLALYQTI